MSGRAFLFIFLFLSLVVILTSPPILGALIEDKATPTATATPPTATPTTTPTLDPFGHLPIATPLGGGSRSIVRSLPPPWLGDLPPTFTPVPPQSFDATHTAQGNGKLYVG